MSLIKKMNKIPMKNIVYGLRDPRNDVYQYIGKSSVGLDRPLQYLTSQLHTKVEEWIAELGSLWLYPEIDVIEEVQDLNDLCEREEHWIKYYSNINPNLLNTQLVEKIILPTRSEKDIEDFHLLFTIIHKISTILKNERTFRNYTQQQIADELKISRSSVGKMERSDYSVSLKMIDDYVRLLKGLEIISQIKKERVRSLI